MKAWINPLCLRMRLYRPDGNPLRRPSDRLESVLVLIALLMVAAGVWFAVPAGRLAYEAASRDERAVVRHHVMATLMQDPPVTRISFTDLPAGDGTAVARWTTPAGESRSGQVPVPPSAKAGAAVPVWINAAGGPTSQPADDTTLLMRGVATGLLVVLGSVLLALSSFTALRGLIDRKRHRQWDADWVLADERWRRPRRP